jgi:FkbM family methyltransferase
MNLTNLGKGLSHLVDLNLLNDNSIIVDGGCSYGSFIKKMREFDNTKNCIIHAIECRKSNMEILLKGNFPNVVFHECALVGDNNDDVVEFDDIISPNDKYHEWGNVKKLNRSTRLKNSNSKIKIETYEVTTIKINDIFNKLSVDKIDYLKMDVEGTEGDIFETMTLSTAKKITQVSMEVHENVNFENLIANLKKLEYTIGGDKHEVYGIQKTN